MTENIKSNCSYKLCWEDFKYNKVLHLVITVPV